MKITKAIRSAILCKYRELLKACEFSLNKEERVLVRKAFLLALKTHRDKKRETGELYFLHSIEIARIVASEMGLGPQAVVCALLQNVLDDPNTKITEISNEFGDETVNLLQGVQKVGRVRTERISVNTELFINLLLTLSPDIRVILIRLANRLHFMRILNTLAAHDKARIASETQNLYTPIAHRLGLYHIKTELEELSMRYTEPGIYYSLEKKIAESKSKQELYIEEFSEPISKELKQMGFDFEIIGRPKSIYSIWQKMKKQNVEFEEVYDVFAIRIILNNVLVDEKSDCWKVYSIVANLYSPNPKRLRDWITKHKPNGYESLHTTVLGPDGRWVEVQIRTERMNRNAESGNAAHWLYKLERTADYEKRWLESFRSSLEKDQSPDKQESKPSQKKEIYVFTPNGDLKRLPLGATVLDFAFEVHTRIGERCAGARVNSLQVPIKHKLANCDEVAIITSKNQKPNLDWLTWVRTTRAKSKIKRFLREAEFSRSDEGRELLRRKLNQLNKPLNDDVLNRLQLHFKTNDSLQLYHLIAEGKIDTAQIKEILQEPDAGHESEIKEKIKQRVESHPYTRQEESDVLLIEGSPAIAVYMPAKCCKPTAGDNVFGFVTVKDGIKLHRADCPNAFQMKTRYAYRIIETKWVARQTVSDLIVTLRITGNERNGLLQEITSVIGNDPHVKLQSVNFSTNPGKSEGTLLLVVNNLNTLDNLMQRLKSIQGVKKIVRQFNNAV